MWKSKSDWGWCLGGAYFLAKFQAGGAYSGGAYKKKRVSRGTFLTPWSHCQGFNRLTNTVITFFTRYFLLVISCMMMKTFKA